MKEPYKTILLTVAGFCLGYFILAGCATVPVKAEVHPCAKIGMTEDEIRLTKIAMGWAILSGTAPAVRDLPRDATEEERLYNDCARDLIVNNIRN